MRDVQNLTMAERTRGRWRDLLLAAGFRSEELSRKNGPCPFCGGRDRWAFLDRDGSGSWICRSCGPASHSGVGDGIELLKRKLGISSYAAVAKWIEALLEGEPETRVEPRIDYRARAEWTWDHGEPIGDSGAAVDHFHSRGINLPRWPSNLRTWNRLLLAKITSPEGEFLSVHVRSLRAREKWRSMRGSYEAGSVVRLWKPKDGVLGIAEGIETAMSAAMIFHIPVWSALSASGIAAFKSAPNVTTLIIFADNDENGAGQQAAETARARLAPSHHSVEVRTPERVGWDWNDVIMRETCNRENVA